MEEIAERVVDLESTLAQFITTTNAAIQRLDRMCERLDRRSEEHERSFQELREEGRKHTLEMAHIANRVGRFAEDIVAPNIPRIAQEAFGIADIELEAPRIKRRHSRDPGRRREFDIVLAGNRQLLVTSVKSTARDGDAADFVEALKEVFFCPLVGGLRLLLGKLRLLLGKISEHCPELFIGHSRKLFLAAGGVKRGGAPQLLASQRVIRDT